LPPLRCRRLPLSHTQNKLGIFVMRNIHHCNPTHTTNKQTHTTTACTT
jgi:hypothetical protein